MFQRLPFWPLDFVASGPLCGESDHYGREHVIEERVSRRTGGRRTKEHGQERDPSEAWPSGICFLL